MNYFLKDYISTNDKAETLIDQAVQMNGVKSVLFNRKTSKRIVKSDSYGNGTILLPDTQEDTEEDDITTNTIIHNETANNSCYKCSYLRHLL